MIRSGGSQGNQAFSNLGSMNQLFANAAAAAGGGGAVGNFGGYQGNPFNQAAFQQSE